MRTTLVALLFLALLGCHTIRFDVSSEPSAEVVEQRNDFFFWGLTPTRSYRGDDVCPHGVRSIRQETRFWNGVASLLTIGIWSPRHSTYSCVRSP